MSGHRLQAYTTAAGKTERQPRVLHMVGHMGVSVLSGAVSTLGCVFFMFFAPNNFFFKFASFMYVGLDHNIVPFSSYSLSPMPPPPSHGARSVPLDVVR